MPTEPRKMIEEKKYAISDYIPYITFKNPLKANEYINKRVNDFFSEKNIKNYKELDHNKVISDIDFKNYKEYSIDYFYNNIIELISKDSDGKINHTIKYAVIFDKDLTPFNTKEDKTGISYGEIKLGNYPIFYYIYINLQEMLRYIKDSL